MIEKTISFLITYAFKLEPSSRLAQTLNFFIYDTVKILLLLFFMIGLIGIVRTYISYKKIQKLLSKKKGASYAIASLFGAITPFCSCSSIPIFMSLLKAGVSPGPAFSFLVTSPMINEYLVVLMLGFFGLKITAAYILFGLMIGVLSGVLIEKFNLGRFIRKDFKASDDFEEEGDWQFSERLEYGREQAFLIVRKLWFWVVLGVGIGAIIHGFIPEEAIHGILEKTGFFSVPLAAILGIPIYANCSAVVPIAVVLFEKGVPLGTALAFMMATAALSLPEAVILKRVMKTQLIIVFFAIVGGGIILVGYIFNAITSAFL
ncbi:MAG: permease [Methanobacteriota archaeon]